MSSIRPLIVAFVLAVAVLGYFAWQKNTQKAAPSGPAAQGEAAPEAGGGMPGGAPAMEAPQQDPGVEWTTPKRWINQLAEGMRLASYVVPGAAGGADGQCAVYFFGPGQGGTVEANMSRWIGEFQNPGSPERTTRTVNGMKVERVAVSGTYMAHSGMGGESQGPQSDWGLLGAIVEGPSGALFFKVTGPAKTIAAAKAEFDAMIGSIKTK